MNRATAVPAFCMSVDIGTPLSDIVRRSVSAMSAAVRIFVMVVRCSRVSELGTRPLYSARIINADSLRE
jgi:hypothetical protein